jgi:hypothetical protein
MRLIWVLLLGMVVSQPVSAAWEKLGEAGDGEAEHATYADPATIRRTENGRRMWTLDSYKQPQTWPTPSNLNVFQSIKALIEFDCTGDRLRELASTRFSREMGEGSSVTSSEPLQWLFVIPGSVGEVRFKLACKQTRK